MKTVVFAWELGPLGHLMNMRRIGPRLKLHGFRFIAAIVDHPRPILFGRRSAKSSPHLDGRSTRVPARSARPCPPRP